MRQLSFMPENGDEDGDQLDLIEEVDKLDEHDPECTGCEHDCPWKRHHFGAPFCQVCDDHAEASYEEEE